MPEEIRETIRVRAPRELVYELWRDPETFVEIVGGLEEAERDGRTLRWAASGPLGMTLQGEAEITQQRKPDKLAWTTLEGALDAEGAIDFEDAGEETVVHYALDMDIPGGAAGRAVARAADPASNVRETLERFKALAEARASAA